MESESVLTRPDDETTPTGVTSTPIHLSFTLHVNTLTPWGAGDLRRQLIEEFYQYFGELYRAHDARGCIIRYPVARLAEKRERTYAFSVITSITNFNASIRGEEIEKTLKAIGHAFEDTTPKVTHMTIREGLHP